MKSKPWGYGQVFIVVVLEVEVEVEVVDAKVVDKELEVLEVLVLVVDSMNAVAVTVRFAGEINIIVISTTAANTAILSILVPKFTT